MNAPVTFEGAVLVTGASGFVGEHLVRRLVGEDVPTVALTHRHLLEVPGADSVSLDLTARDRIRRLIDDRRPAVVFHCAALTDVAECQRDPHAARQAIVDATTNLVDAVRAIDADTALVALSTDLVFDGQRAPYDESALAQPVSTYGQLKLEAEEPPLSLPHGAVLRAALVYGAPMTHKSSFLGWMIDTLRAGKPLNLFADEYRTPVFVNDLCTSMIQAAQQRLAGLWHAGGPQRLSRVEMGELVCQRFGFSPELLVARKLAESTYAAPRPPDVSLDSTRLWSALHHAPKPFLDAILSI